MSLMGVIDHALAALALLAMFLSQASLFRMMSEDEVFIVNAGEDVILPCHFHLSNFSKFNNPIIWHKQQRGEVSRVNLGANILPPFHGTQRLHLSLLESAPTYSLKLTLRGITLEDSGNYSCVVRGRGNREIGKVTHYIFVKASVEKLFFMDYLHPDGHILSNGSKMTLNEGQSDQFSCVSIGGYPPPEVTIYADDIDITRSFSISRYNQLVGEQSLKLIVCEIVATYENYIPSIEEDGRRLRCEAASAGMPPTVTYATILVNHAPRIHCPNKEAEVGQRNIYIRCKIVSKPAHLSVFWIIDSKGTTLTVGEVKHDMWTLIMDHEDPYEVDVHLYIREVTKDLFREFSIFAENVIDVSSQKVSLRQKVKKDPVLVTQRPSVYDYLDTMPLKVQEDHKPHEPVVAVKEAPQTSKADKNNFTFSTCLWTIIMAYFPW